MITQQRKPTDIPVVFDVRNRRLQQNVNRITHAGILGSFGQDSKIAGFKRWNHNRCTMISHRAGPTIVVWLLTVLISGCAVSSTVQPSIEITTVPPADKGGVIELDVD